jgi:hypothetical protein
VITTTKLEEENCLLKRQISEFEEKIRRMEEQTSVEKQNTIEEIHNLEDQLHCKHRLLLEKWREIDNLNALMKRGRQCSETIDLCDKIDKLKKAKANLKLCLKDSRKKIDILNAKVSERDSVIQIMMHASVDTINYTEESVNTNTEIVRNIPHPQVKAENQETTNGRKERCWACNVTHCPDDCRMKFQICFNCRQTGHTAACCTKEKLYHVQLSK